MLPRVRVEIIAAGLVRFPAVKAALKLNPVAGEAYLFPAPKAEGKPWGQRYTWGLLRKAERAAKVEHLERGTFHP